LLQIWLAASAKAGFTTAASPHPDNEALRSYQLPPETGGAVDGVQLGV